MDEARWQALQDLFGRALELPASERDAFLSGACADASLRAEVVSLLAAAEEEGPIDVLARRLTPVRDIFSEQVPSQVGPYTVSERIGAGGMAVVYRGHDPRLQRDVALKFLPATLLDHSPAADRLIGEARAASALDHPNICTIYDIASADDRLFIAMAYYAGGTLEDRLREGPLPVAEAIDIARQVAEALQCAHEAGIVHRDVKPANIAFGERGEVKVLDFGVAVLADEAPEGATAGTPLYMAPEQVRGDGTDPGSDVWALGVVLFEMLTGRRPFGGGDRDEIHDEILHADPPALTSLRPGVPQRVAAIVDRALAKDPARRYPSAAAFAEALAAARVALVPAPSWPRRAFMAAAAVLLIVAVASISRLDAPATSLLREPDTPLDEQYVRARTRFFSGTPEGTEAAIVILLNMMTRDSTDARARALLASAYAVATRADYSRHGRREWLDSAMVHANAAIALAPELPDGHAALGTVLRWQGRLDEARARFNRALELDPRHAVSMIELGFIHHLLRNVDTAVVLLEHGLAMEPDVPAARQYAAALYRLLELPGEARRHIATGRLIAPDNTDLIWEAVLVALLEDDTVTARAEFDAYLHLIPEAERERMRAWYHSMMQDPAGARAHLDRLDLTNAPWYDLRQFGLTWMHLGERERGAALLRRALAAMDSLANTPEWGRTDADYQRAYVYAALGRADEAIAALDQWDQRGGLVSWSRPDRQRVWSTVADDPRFTAIVRRSDERFQEKRARVLADLERMRD